MATTTYVDSTFSVSTIGGRTDPAGVAVPDYTAEEARFVAEILTAGYLKPIDSFKVSAQDTPNMSVRVGSGTAKEDFYVIEGAVGGQGNYVVRLDVASQNLTVPAADVSQSRLDEVYLVVRDDTYDASARGVVSLAYRRGDLGGAHPGPDAAWGASGLLGQVNVAAAETSIDNSNIIDERLAANLLSELLGPPPVLDHGALTGLIDNDHPQYVLKSLADAKGDLIAGTAADSFARLPVGPDGHVLVTDSTQTTGVKWVSLADVVGGPTMYVVKTVNESVSSLIVVQDDNQLFFDVGANETWEVETFLYASGSSGDLRWNWSAPTGAVGAFGSNNPPQVQTPADATAMQLGSIFSVSRELGTQGSVVEDRLLVINGSTAGTVRLRWCQATSSSSATTVFAGSYLRATKITE